MTPTTGATPFEVGARSRCSRARSSRGRPQQCARAAARTSSSWQQFGSRGSSLAARSRSSTRSGRPSSEVELRGPATVELPCFTTCATGFVSSILTNAIDDVAIEVEYYFEDEVEDSTEPTIAEGSEEEMSSQDGIARQLQVCVSDGEESDVGSSCAFYDDVCSVASENPCGAEDMDDMLLAARFAKTALSDDALLQAFECNTSSHDDAEEDVEFLGEAPLCSHDLAFDFASSILGGAFGQMADGHVECLEEVPPCSDDLAFDFASSILDGAFVEVVDTWTEQETSLSAMKIESLKQKARETLLKVASESLKSKLQAAKVASEMSETETLRLSAQKAFANGLENGDLGKVFAEIKAKAAAASERKELEAVKLKVRQALSKGLQTGDLALALSSNVEAAAALEQSKAVATLKAKVRQALSHGLQSGSLSKALGAALEKDAWKDVRQKVRNSFTDCLADGSLNSIMQELRQVDKPAAAIVSEVPTTPSVRSLSSSRSRRRIIGGVVRSPAMQQDMLPKQHSKSSRKSAQETPKAFHIDCGVESAGEEETTPARSSSLARSYDTLGAQFFTLNDGDDATSSRSGCSARKLSKARTRFHEASLSAMAMDLRAAPPASTSSTFRTFVSEGPPSSRPKDSAQAANQASPSFRTTFTPMPVNFAVKMRPSSSLGSLGSTKMKLSPGGLLPFLAPDKQSAESIAWTVQVSKTTPKWHSTGLRGSSSMIF